MTYQPPNKSRLRADAGWSLYERGNAHPEKALALDKFRDGCEALLEYAEEPTGAEAAKVVSEPRRDGSVVKLPAPDKAAPPPIIQFLPTDPIRDCRDGGQHRFDMYNQRCKFCDVTRKEYLSEKNRKPELMEL